MTILVNINGILLSSILVLALDRQRILWKSLLDDLSSHTPPRKSADVSGEGYRVYDLSSWCTVFRHFIAFLLTTHVTIPCFVLVSNMWYSRLFRAYKRSEEELVYYRFSHAYEQLANEDSRLEWSMAADIPVSPLPRASVGLHVAQGGMVVLLLWAWSTLARRAWQKVRRPLLVALQLWKSRIKHELRTRVDEPMRAHFQAIRVQTFEIGDKLLKEVRGWYLEEDTVFVLALVVALVGTAVFVLGWRVWGQKEDYEAAHNSCRQMPWERQCAIASLQGENPFDILGVERNATMKEIKRAYRKMIQPYRQFWD